MRLVVEIPSEKEKEVIVEYNGVEVKFDNLNSVGNFVDRRVWGAIRLRKAPDTLSVSYSFPLSNRDDIQPVGALDDIDEYLAQGWKYADPPIRGDYNEDIGRFIHTVYLEKEVKDEMV